ncbi:hypothetical protein Barb4_01171 [Bacteroidales bacterium Barb4]|nr:hypothetical protein Barb4_01171 [Bacteroidales bacterium Barb4]
MKRLIIFFFLALFYGNAYSQYLKKYHGMYIGFSQSHGDNIKSYMGLDLDATLFNVKFIYHTNFEYASENTYGKGYLTDKETQEAVLLGYSFFRYHQPKIGDFYITPIIGILTSKFLYSDKYYGKVATENNTTKYPVGLCINYTVRKSINTSGGFSIGLLVTSYMSGLNIGYAM